MSLLQTVGRESFYHILFEIDGKNELEAKEACCPKCGSRLDRGRYKRKPRGGPPGLPDQYLVRLSLCCCRKGCRKRVLPRSVLFDGRRVYLRVTILVAMALRGQSSGGYTMRKLQTEFGVDSKTVRRWQKAFRERFWKGRWRGIGSRFPGGLPVGVELETIVSFFVDENDSESGMVRLLRFLSVYEHPDPGKTKVPQKMGRRL